MLFVVVMTLFFVMLVLFSVCSGLEFDRLLHTQTIVAVTVFPGDYSDSGLFLIFCFFVLDYVTSGVQLVSSQVKGSS